MSSKYTKTKWSIKGLSTLFNGLMKVLGALNKANGKIRHSHNSFLVLKAVFHSSPSLILIWRYPLSKSIVEKKFNPSSIGRGYL